MASRYSGHGSSARLVAEPARGRVRPSHHVRTNQTVGMGSIGASHGALIRFEPLGAQQDIVHVPKPRGASLTIAIFNMTRIPGHSATHRRHPTGSQRHTESARRHEVRPHTHHIRPTHVTMTTGMTMFLTLGNNENLRSIAATIHVAMHLSTKPYIPQATL